MCFLFRYAQLRASIIACIMSTDMSEHFSLQVVEERNVKKSSDFFCSFQAKLDSQKKDLTNTADLMCCLVHSCDISNVGKPWELSFSW